MRQFLLEKRILAGLSRTQLAKELGVCESTICKVEKGTRTPSVPLAYKWCKKLRIPKKEWLSIFFRDEADNMCLKGE